MRLWVGGAIESWTSRIEEKERDDNRESRLWSFAIR